METIREQISVLPGGFYLRADKDTANGSAHAGEQRIVGFPSPPSSQAGLTFKIWDEFFPFVCSEIRELARSALHPR